MLICRWAMALLLPLSVSSIAAAAAPRIDGTEREIPLGSRTQLRVSGPYVLLPSNGDFPDTVTDVTVFDSRTGALTTVCTECLESVTDINGDEVVYTKDQLL